MSNDSDPWRTRGDYEEDRRRMKWVAIDANKRPKKVIRDLTGVEDEVKRIKLIICQIHAYLYRNELPAIQSMP
ncbi:MAG: hypothetical protein ACREVH_13815 [Gammaproteobacteria bacterium]